MVVADMAPYLPLETLEFVNGKHGLMMAKIQGMISG